MRDARDERSAYLHADDISIGDDPRVGCAVVVALGFVQQSWCSGGVKRAPDIDDAVGDFLSVVIKRHHIAEVGVSEGVDGDDVA